MNREPNAVSRIWVNVIGGHKGSAGGTIGDSSRYPLEDLSEMTRTHRFVASLMAMRAD
jgi:hypothetical protein